MNQDCSIEFVVDLVELKKALYIVYIKDDEADVVKMIYDMAINGYTLKYIQTELYNRGIKYPTGKDKWTRDVIDKTVNNKKVFSLYYFNRKLCQGFY